MDISHSVEQITTRERELTDDRFLLVCWSLDTAGDVQFVCVALYDSRSVFFFARDSHRECPSVVKQLIGLDYTHIKLLLYACVCLFPESGQLEVMPEETSRAHHRPSGRGEEAGAGGTRSAAPKIENVFRNDGGAVSFGATHLRFV